MEETDRIYGWISSVINSCKEPAHIELCDVLITLYEKKGAAKDLVKGLRESLKIKVVLIQEDNKNRQQASMEDRIWDLFSSGKYNVKQIAEIVKMDLRKCDAIITRKLNK